MSLLFKKSEVRSSSLQEMWGTGDYSVIDGGKYKSALGLVPVYAATGLIADAFASSPWAAYVRSDGVSSRAAVQPSLIVDPGVFGLDLYSWKHQLVSSLALWGNAYGLATAFDSTGTPSKVAWLRPDRVLVDEQLGRAPRFFYEGQQIDQASLIHIPWYTVPGSVKGMSPLELFRVQVDTGLEAQKTGKNFFRRGAVPSGLLKYTKSGITADVAAAAKARFVQSVSSNEPFVHGSDWEYSALSLPASDVNFIAGVKLTANQIAAIYRVDPEDVGGETGGSTLKYATLEMNEQRFNSRTLLPVAKRVESVIDRHLPPAQYVKCNLDARVRTDLKTRYEAHKIALEAGFKTVDEVRALEELKPLGGQVVPAAGE
jgi:HK97 family phage portal protein